MQYRYNIKKILFSPDIKNFSRFSYGEIIGFVSLYLVSFLINKKLSEEQLGAFSYNYNLILFIYPIFSLNIFENYLRFLSKKEINKDNLKKTIKKVALLSTLVLFICISFFFGEIKSAFLSFIILYNERLYYFRGTVKTTLYSLLKVLSSSLILIFVLTSIWLDSLNYSNIIFCYGLSYLISTIVGHVITSKEKNESIGNNVQLSVLAKYSLPIVGTSIVTWLLNFSDLYFIEYFYSLKEVGEYAISNRALNIIRIITGLFLVYWPIIYFREFDCKNYLKAQKIRIVYIVILAIFSIITIYFSTIIYIATGASKYLNYTSYFKLLTIAEFFRIVAGLFLTYRSFRIQTYYNLFSIIFVAIFNIILNILFLKTFGVIFAAYSTLIATLLYFLISIFVSLLPEYKYARQNRH